MATKPGEFPLPRSLARLDGLMEEIAKDAGIRVVLVRCATCGSEMSVGGAKCLREGWPLCCGETMLLVTRRPDATD